MDTNGRLPSLRDIMASSLDPHDTLGPFHPHAKGSRSLSNGSWTAINHHSAGPRPPSPPNASTTLLSPLHPNPDKQGTQSRHPPAATSPVASSINLPNIRSPTSPSLTLYAPGPHANTKRQDSAVFTSSNHPPPSHSAGPPTAPSGIFPLHVGSNPATPHRPAFSHVAEHPVTPPPDTALVQKHAASLPPRPISHDRPHGSPTVPTHSPLSRARDRSLSDPRTSATGTSPHSLQVVNGRSSMPPPPVPATGPAPASTSASTEAPSTSPEASAAPPTATAKLASGHAKPSVEPPTCRYCQETWIYPPPDNMQSLYSQNGSELGKKMEAWTPSWEDYGRRRNISYNDWLQRHRVESTGTSNTCAAALAAGAQDESSGSGTKRRADELWSDGSPSVKVRKLSGGDARPLSSQLTPPPEQAARDHYAPERTASGHPIHQDEDGAKLVIDPDVARILGKAGAPPSQYERPANDDSNMWYRKSK